MPVVVAGLGVRINAPPGVAVTPVVGSGPALAAAATSPQASPLDEALLASGFHVAADVRVSGSATSSAPAAALAATAPTIAVDVGAQEGALVLVETADGVFAWNYPQARRVQPAGLGLAAPGGATLVFSLAPIAAPTSAAPALAFGLSDLVSPVLHWVLGKVVDGVRARVLKFAASVAVGAAVDRIEGGDVTGLTSLAPDNPALWKPGGAPIATLPPPAAGAAPPQVLLMVHGTFSNTTGSFGALSTTNEGRAFLAQARSRYGAVWGFDHKTLAVGPDANASDMAVALQPLLPQGTVIDAVAYSRGGLVFRELAERLLPQVRPDLVLRKAVFVGCTNGGTHLAEPQNWKALVDIYTNIAMAAARMISAAAAAPLGGVVAGAVIQILGGFVQYLSVVAITDRQVPGLAGMEPEPIGAIVHALNNATTGLGNEVVYNAITSQFKPVLDLSKGITKDLEELLVSGVTSDLFTDSNDLVVDTDFMTALGVRQAELTGGQVFAFGAGDRVYHTNYFAAPQTAQKLAEWLS